MCPNDTRDARMVKSRHERRPVRSLAEVRACIQVTSWRFGGRPGSCYLGRGRLHGDESPEDVAAVVRAGILPAEDLIGSRPSGRGGGETGQDSHLLRARAASITAISISTKLSRFACFG
jgi:hypothetical protein